MNTRGLAVMLLIAVCGSAAGCSGLGVGGTSMNGAPEVSAEQTFSLTSPSFANGSAMPPEHATDKAGGKNSSPGLEWSGAPVETKSYAIECIDLAPMANNWVHWLVVNVPAAEDAIPAGASGDSLPPAAIELENGFRRTGWGGPQPPRGTGAHEYRFTVYALDVATVALATDTSLAEFRKAIQGHVLAKATLTGTFER